MTVAGEAGPLGMDALDAMTPDAFAAALGGLFGHSPWVVAGVAAARPFGTGRALLDALMARVRGAGVEEQSSLIAAHPELAGKAWDAVELVTGRAAVIAEIGRIAETWLTRRLGRETGSLSVHALDTVRGGAAADLGFTLHGERLGGWRQLAAGRTNAQGRTDGPLLAGLDLEPGAYRVDYAVGAYHRAQGLEVARPAFLEVVGIGFGIADVGSHYHIPLQFTPWSYATYRGG